MERLRPATLCAGVRSRWEAGLRRKTPRKGEGRSEKDFEIWQRCGCWELDISFVWLRSKAVHSEQPAPHGGGDQVIRGDGKGLAWRSFSIPQIQRCASYLRQGSVCLRPASLGSGRPPSALPRRLASCWCPPALRPGCLMAESCRVRWHGCWPAGMPVVFLCYSWGMINHVSFRFKKYFFIYPFTD